MEVVEVEVADLAEVVAEVEAADSAEEEEVVDEEEVEVDFSMITIFHGRDGLSLIPVTLFNLCSRARSRKYSERVGRDTCPLTIYIDTSYFFENSMKMIHHFKEKRMAMAPSAHP